MKKEASGKKGKVLWIVLGIVLALAIVAGVILALTLGGEDTSVGGRPDLYWNIDREENVDKTTGLSTRKPAEDGNYYVRFAHDGEQIELAVGDKKLVNYIDGLALSHLVFDKSGTVIDVLPPQAVASVVGEALYVERVEGDTLYANSSVAMNGRKITVKLNEDVTIYNVSGKGEFVGEPLKAEDLNTMDTIGVYGTFVPEDSEEETVVTHIFVTNKPVESPVYWRADAYYDSSNATTARIPDENGAYTIKWFVDGQTVDLKCKDKELVAGVDKADYHWVHWGLEFDEEGYIVALTNSALSSRTLLQCERFDITEIYDDGSYVATSLIKNNGSFVQGKVTPETKIYDVSKAARSEGRVNERIDSLKLGDRVCIWTDTQGNPVLIYVSNRMVESDIYWVNQRFYTSATKSSSRVPNADGLYEIPLLRVGDSEDTMYYTDNFEHCVAIDVPADRCVGLKLGEGNMIEAVYDTEALFGHTAFTTGYFVMDITGSVGTYLSPAGSGFSKNGVLASDCKVINVSTVGEYGAETTLQIGDSVHAYRAPNGDLAHVFVARRITGPDSMYWRITSRAYDAEKKVTTREPDADGYYVYEFAHGGKVVTLKTKSKEIASKVDAASSQDMGLTVKNGIILEVHDYTYPFGGNTSRGYFIKEITENKITIYNNSGKEYTEVLADNCQFYNVSNCFEDHMGEKIKPQVGDYVYCYRDMYYEIGMVLVAGRGGDKLAWPVINQNNVTKMGVADEDGWYYVDLAVDGKVSTYKTQNKNHIDFINGYTSAIGLRASGNVIKNVTTYGYVSGIFGRGVQNYTVTGVSGNTIKTVYTLGHASSTGTTKDLVLNEGAKIYDVSDPESENFGKPAKVKVGDMLLTFTYQKDRNLTEYVYIVAHCTREGGYKSYCEHCDKVVYWNPYIQSANAARYDTHYYLATDVLHRSQMWAYGSDQENLQLVLDLNGHTLSTSGNRAAYVRYGATLNLMDSVGGGMITSQDTNATGSVICVDGASEEYPVSTLNIYSGVITKIKGANDTKTPARSGLIQAGGVINMYGGELKDGYVYSPTGASTSCAGVYITTGGTFNMYGGKVADCYAASGYSEKAILNPDGTPVIDEVTGLPKTEKTYATTYGGNFFLGGEGAEINIYDGVIEGGTAGRGGNFMVQTGTLNVYGGTISGGIATTECGPSGGRGGNMFINGTATVNLMGGIVKDGNATSMGGNLMNSSNNSYLNISGDAVVSNGKTSTGNGGQNISLMYANLNVSGGSILLDDPNVGANITTAGTTSSGYSTVNISGGKINGEVELSGGIGNDTDKYPDYRAIATISGGEMDYVDASLAQKLTISGKPVIKNLQPAATLLLDVGEMADGANVTVNTAGVFTKPVEKAADYVGYFHCKDANFVTSVTAENELKFSNPNATGGYCEHCNTEADWLPWDGASVVSGHYYLTDNVQLAGELTVTADVTYDLRGFTITAAPNSRVFNVKGGGILNVIDTSANETGVITGGCIEGRGGNIYVDSSSCAFNLYGGTITGGESKGEVSATNARGGNIFAYGNVTLYGGTVSYGKSTTGNGMGANIMMTGATLTVHEDATIIGGQGKNSVNVALMYADLVNYGQILSDGKTEASVGVSSMANRRPATFVMESGLIDGIVKVSSGTLSAGVEDFRAQVQIKGGKIGELELVDAYENTVSFSGAPIVDKMTVNAGVLIDVAQLTDGASLKVAGTSGVLTNAMDNANDVVGYFDAVASGYDVVVNADNKLEIASTGAVDPNPPAGEGNYCEHCQTEVQWTDWNGAAFETSGHYRMTDNVQSAGQITIASGVEVTLDLNGYTLTSKNGQRNFDVVGTLIIQDTSAEGTGTVVGSTITGVHGGNMRVNGGTFHLYSGTITGGVVATSGYYGGNLMVSGANAAAYIHGGVISNGSAERGGNIYVSNDTTVVISGDAQILDGYTTVVSTAGRGGNIYVTGLDSSLVVSENAVIANGLAGLGGNICSMYGNVTIEGNCQIKDGTAVKQNNGNLSIGGTGSAGSLTITGGTFSGSRTVVGAGAGTIPVTISGGTFLDEVEISTNVDLTISGAPVFDNLKSASPIKVGALTDGASVKINAEAGAVLTDALDNANEVVGYFDTVAVDGTVIVNAENKLEVAAACPCGCKTLASEVEWISLNDNFALKFNSDAHYKLTADLDVTQLHEGAGKQFQFGNSSACNVTIDLNGFTLYNKHRSYIFAGSTVTIVDTSAEGTGKWLTTGDVNPGTAARGFYLLGALNLRSGTIALADGAVDANQALIDLYNDAAVLNVYGGTIMGGRANTLMGTTVNTGLGGNIKIRRGTVNIYGGTITGGTATTLTEGNVDYHGRGGNIYVTNIGVLNIYGGTVTDGVAGEGADVYVATSTTDGGTVNISGGTVGDVYVPGSKAVVNVSGVANIENLNLQSDALVTVGDLSDGAQIKVANAGVFTDVLENAESYVPYFAGLTTDMTVEVTVDSKLELVSSNACPCGCGADKDAIEWKDINEYINSSITTTFCKITENAHIRLNADLDVDTCFGKAKQVMIGSSDSGAAVVATIDLNGYTLSTSNRLYVCKPSTLTVIDTSAQQTGQIKCTADGSTGAGALFYNAGVLNLRSGKITMDANSSGEFTKGGLVYVNAGTFNMYGGSVENGKALSSKGGNVYLHSGTFNMYDGVITGGDAPTGANVWVSSSATLNHLGGTIDSIDTTVTYE